MDRNGQHCGRRSHTDPNAGLKQSIGGVVHTDLMVHLAELISRRAVPAAGVFALLTRRCPLGCRHCSTRSGPAGEQHDETMFQRFAASFTAASHPEYLLLTGGEPLLRPALAADLASTARSAGTRTYLLTGLYFARQARTSLAVRRAIGMLDHLAVSLDAWHEEFVPRRDVFRVVHELLDQGTELSFQITGSAADDPYLAATVAAVRTEFRDRVPMLVGTVQPYGRARTLLAGKRSAATADPMTIPSGPCGFAAWPVIGHSGVVTACCNQAVVDASPAPEHLRLGHANIDGWPRIRERCLSAPLLSAIRLLGPLDVAGLAGERASGGYCRVCQRLSAMPEAQTLASRLAARSRPGAAPPRRAGNRTSAAAVAFARRYGCRRYCDLVLLGLDGPVP